MIDMGHKPTASFGKRVLLSAINTASRLVRRTKDETGASEINNILVVELWNIGDIVLLLPFLGRLRAAYPNAKITLLARPHARLILEGSGLVDEYLDDGASSSNWLSLNPIEGGWGDLWRLKDQLSGRRFDMAFQCRPHVREHLILSMSGARRRVGLSFGDDDTVLTDSMRLNDSTLHKAEDWLKLAEIAGVPIATASPALHVLDDEKSEAIRFLRSNGVKDEDVLIAVHPGASTPEKRWPLERFADVARILSTRDGTRVMTFTDPAGYGAPLGRIANAIEVKAGLREMIALISQCSVLIGNDSGPMHLAGALGVPTVAVFGSGIAQWFAPLGEGHEVVTAESTDATRIGALGEIAVERVIEAVDRVLTRQSPGRPRS